jgi:hypothetical protein
VSTGELIFLIVIMVAPGVAPIGVVLIHSFRTRRERRAEHFRRQQQLAAEREAARMLEGLPPHPRCLCERCRAWRLVPGNSEQLRLRGLR